MKVSRIVAATEWSVMSRAAIAHARALAEWHDADLHVVQLGGGTKPFRESQRSFSDELRKVRELDTTSARVTFETRTGRPVEELVGYARGIDADLIVVGTAMPNAGMSQRESVGEIVARSAHCATLVVPLAVTPAIPDRLFRNIVCGVDLAPGSDAVVERALVLAQGAGGALTLIHVLRELDDVPAVAHLTPAEYRRLRESDVSRLLWARVPEDALSWAEVDVRVRAGDPAGHLLACSRDVRADLIVIGTRPLSTLSRLLRAGSTTRRVTLGSGCPVLVLPVPSGAAREAVPFGTEMTGAYDRASNPDRDWAAAPCVTA